MRTKNQIRASKSKGNQLEYSVYDSLKPIYSDLKLTKQLGFITQYDLILPDRFVIECKCHKHLSWNEMLKYLKKLESVAPPNHKCYLIVKMNNTQPLVMLNTQGLGRVNSFTMLVPFEDYFETKFIIHNKIYKSAEHSIR